MIFIIWGEDKSCKSTLALSFSKPLVHMEFDIGGFRRAERNIGDLHIKDWTEQGLIKTEPYIIPFQLGSIDPITNIIRPSKIVVGMRELFYQFAGGFIKHLNDPEIKTIVVDTGTLLYETTCMGYIQEKQEMQLPLRPDGMGKDGKPLRTSLLPVEYREPYIRMRGFIYQAKAHDKNLVMTHHATDEYGMVRLKDGGLGEGKTGKRMLHGWGQLGDGADIMVHTWWDKALKKPFCEVELAEVKELEGMTFETPNYEKIITTTKMMRGEA